MIHIICVWHLIFCSILLQSEHFLMNLCKEVSLRLQGCGVQGRTITLKVVMPVLFISFWFD